MNLCSLIKPENLKDYFYIFGIFSTFLMTSITVFVTIQNRRNTLRENVYKEQFAFASKIISELYNLHADLTRLNHGYTTIEISETKAKIEKIFEIIFSNTHLGSEKILLESSNTLELANKMINDSEKKQYKTNYNDYFQNYMKLINIIREELGIDKLSKENEGLFK